MWQKWWEMTQKEKESPVLKNLEWKSVVFILEVNPQWLWSDEVCIPGQSLQLTMENFY